MYPASLPLHPCRCGATRVLHGCLVAWSVLQPDAASNHRSFLFFASPFVGSGVPDSHKTRASFPLSLPGQSCSLTPPPTTGLFPALALGRFGATRVLQDTCEIASLSLCLALCRFGAARVLQDACEISSLSLCLALCRFGAARVLQDACEISSLVLLSRPLPLQSYPSPTRRVRGLRYLFAAGPQVFSYPDGALP